MHIVREYHSLQLNYTGFWTLQVEIYSKKRHCGEKRWKTIGCTFIYTLLLYIIK